jgi:hypothetical protein
LWFLVCVISKNAIAQMFEEWRPAMNFNMSNPAVIIGAGAIVLLVVIAIVVTAVQRARKRRTQELRRRFGPEYELALREFGSRREAEATLMERMNRVKGMNIRPLTIEERDRYLADWDSLQARFIDHPRSAVTDADEMINSLLQTRGYQIGTFDNRAADVSVYHSPLVEPYRRANAITVRAGKNEATTEELRSAIILYRALFEELIQAKTDVPVANISRPAAA